jgi:hypothetical protein
MAQLTRDDVVAALGRVDDLTTAEIIATGASRQELAEALAWLANDEPLLNSGRALASGRTGRLVEILAAKQEDEEALLESGRA